MGISSRKPVDARPGHGPDRRPGRAQAAPRCPAAKAVAAGLILGLLGAFGAAAETIRIATWHVELSRKGPGLLLRDILKGEDPQVHAVVETLAQVSPDVVLLTGIDWDAGLQALRALERQVAARGEGYPHLFALRPNRGLQSGLDLDGDGRLGGAGDAQGWGRFIGDGGMALMSRLPIETGAVRDFSALLWRDLPGALLPRLDGAPFPSAEALEVQRLSSTGHWDVPLVTPEGPLHLLAFSAETPVFDGPEDRNGRRNHDEIALWRHYLDGALNLPPPEAPVVVLGNANLDPVDGKGRHEAIAGLLSHPRLQDPRPASAGGARAAEVQGGANARHRGDPALDTADWSDEGDGPGNLRVSYVLPDAPLRVVGAGVVWPVEGDALAPLYAQPEAPRHRLVWVDLRR